MTRPSTAWPNLFIAGVPKAGSRSLTHALGAHPDVFVPVLDCPRFFIAHDIDQRRAEFFRAVLDQDEYLALFAPGRDARYRCDSSVEYVLHPEAMERIRQVSPDARAIVVLRDPVQRAYSHYLNDVREGVERRSFLEAVRAQLADPGSVSWPSRYVPYGHYAASLERALELFGSEIHVVLFEELTRDSEAVLAGIAAFLDLPWTGSAASELDHRNRAELPRGRLAGRAMGSRVLRRAVRTVLPAAIRPLVRGTLLGAPAPAMDPEARALLIDEYRFEPAAVADLIGRAPQWPSFLEAAA